MLNKIKYFSALMIMLTIVFACTSDKSDKDKKNTQVQQKDTVKINKDQYRIAENFVGSKDQIIDLIQGPVTFEILHQGSGKFIVNLKNADGVVVENLVNVTGDFKGKKRMNIAETRAYILDVETEGTWSVYRE